MISNHQLMGGILGDIETAFDSVYARRGFLCPGVGGAKSDPEELAHCREDMTEMKWSYDTGAHQKHTEREWRGEEEEEEEEEED